MGSGWTNRLKFGVIVSLTGLLLLAACGCGRRVTVIEGPNGGTVTRIHRPLRPDVTVVKPAP